MNSAHFDREELTEDERRFSAAASMVDGKGWP